jgi:hypothetical protein
VTLTATNVVEKNEVLCQKKTLQQRLSLFQTCFKSDKAKQPKGLLINSGLCMLASDLLTGELTARLLTSNDLTVL